MSEPTTPDSASAAKPAANRRSTMIIIGGGLLIGALGGLYVATPKLAAATTSEADAHKNAEPAANQVMHLIENIVVNPAQTGGTRFLMLSIAVEARNAEVEGELKARDSEVRDTVLRVLSTKTVLELTDLARRDSLKSELHSAIASKFATGKVGMLFLPQFVIQ